MLFLTSENNSSEFLLMTTLMRAADEGECWVRVYGSFASFVDSDKVKREVSFVFLNEREIVQKAYEYLSLDTEEMEED